MGAMFTMLFAKVTAVVAWFSSLFVAMFTAIWNVVTDLGCWVLEQLLKVVTTAIQAIDFNGMAAYGNNVVLPAEILNVLGLLGVGTAIAIITTAIGIRVALQLIPFVRLGS